MYSGFLKQHVRSHSPLRRQKISHSKSIVRGSYPAVSSVLHAQSRIAEWETPPLGGRTPQSCSSALLPLNNTCHFFNSLRPLIQPFNQILRELNHPAKVAVTFMS